MPPRCYRESKYVKPPHIPKLSRLSMHGQFSFFLVDQNGMWFLHFRNVFLLFWISMFHLLISCHTSARVRVGLPSFRSCPPMPTRENFALFLPSSTAWLQFSNWGHKIKTAAKRSLTFFCIWEQLRRNLIYLFHVGSQFGVRWFVDLVPVNGHFNFLIELKDDHGVL